MAEYCKQCAMEEFGEESNDLAGISKPKDTAKGLYANGLCEGCAPNLVDHTGLCVSADCARKHGTVIFSPDKVIW